MRRKDIEWRQSVTGDSFFSRILSNKIHCGKFIIKTKRTTKRSKFYSLCARQTRNFYYYYFFLSFLVLTEKKVILVCGEWHANWTTNKCQNYTKWTDQILFFLSSTYVRCCVHVTYAGMHVACVYLLSFSKHTSKADDISYRNERAQGAKPYWKTEKYDAVLRDGLNRHERT